jgi:hypothetical protein
MTARDLLLSRLDDRITKLKNVKRRLATKALDKTIDSLSSMRAKLEENPTET